MPMERVAVNKNKHFNSIQLSTVSGPKWLMRNQTMGIRQCPDEKPFWCLASTQGRV